MVSSTCCTIVVLIKSQIRKGRVCDYNKRNISVILLGYVTVHKVIMQDVQSDDINLTTREPLISSFLVNINPLSNITKNKQKTILFCQIIHILHTFFHFFCIFSNFKLNLYFHLLKPIVPIYIRKRAGLLKIIVHFVTVLFIMSIVVVCQYHLFSVTNY